jgi:3-deoxy-D-manno-octulosonic-acid transferase
MAAAAHTVLAARFPGLLTVVVPRHPQRGAAIAAALTETGVAVTRRSGGALPDAATGIYLADTLGELGLVYRLVPVVCIGGSLVPHGGHNPVEPAQFGCAVIHGPHMTNFDEVAAALESADGAVRLASADGLAEAVDRLLRDPEARRRIGEAARASAERQRAVVERILEALEPLLAGAGLAAGRP